MTSPENRVVSFSTDHKNHPAPYNGALQKEQNILGKKIAEARNAAQISQRELSEKFLGHSIKVSAAAISKWEKGDSMPNPYQLFALCYILKIDNMLDYFTGGIPEACDYTPELNQQGLNLLHLFKDALISSGQYAPKSRRAVSSPEPEIPMRIFDKPAAAGPGNSFLDGSYQMINVPANSIPEGAEFGVRVSGISMLPRYVDKQIVWVEKCTEWYNGEIGIFYYNDNAYIKKYVVEQPTAEESKDYIDEATGRITPKITLLSLNRECSDLDVEIKFGNNFYIIGRVLN